MKHESTKAESIRKEIGKLAAAIADAHSQKRTIRSGIQLFFQLGAITDDEAKQLAFELEKATMGLEYQDDLNP